MSLGSSWERTSLLHCYVGLPDDEEGFDFNERFTRLKKEFEAQLKEEEMLNEAIKANLRKVKLV